jgi:hypothetical protein
MNSDRSCKAKFGARASGTLTTVVGLLLAGCLAETTDRAATIKSINNILGMSARQGRHPPVELVEI